MFKTHLFLKSLRCALNGIATVHREEQNIRIHTIGAVVALAAAVVLKFSLTEFALLIGTIAMVFLCEFANSAGERFIDILHPRVSPLAGALKDILAGMVVIAAGASMCIGLLLYLPKILERIVFAGTL